MPSGVGRGGGTACAEGLLLPGMQKEAVTGARSGILMWLFLALLK